MGSFASKLGFGNRDVRLLMVGLDAAGKTTILYKLKLGEVVTTIPTIGFNVETVANKNINFTVWDVGTRGQIRPLWRHYYQNTNAVIFVLDSNDRERLGDAVEEFLRLLNEDELKDAVVLVLCNKQDLPNAMSLTEIRAKFDELGKDRIPSTCVWNMMESCATTGQGLYEALDWVASTLDTTLKMEAQVPELIKKQAETKEASEYKLSLPKNWKTKVDSVNAANELDDEAFLKSLQDSKFLDKQPKGWFSHAALIRLIRLRLSAITDRSKGRKEAVDAIFEDTKRVANSFRNEFHLTHTYFWIQLTDLALHIPPQNTNPLDESPEDPAHVRDLKLFLNAYPFLLNGDLLAQFYSPASVFAERAHYEFVLPDKQPLPSVLSFRSAVSA